ncbi:MAG: formate--tetrahydrofolate ligase [Candidatus Omnitrophica bacterium]|nr:formate--tetrahydrofolate ligase [Candidatus Omnitrophota bacterium]
MGLNTSERVLNEFKIKHVGEIAKKIGIPADSLKLFGNHIAKMPIDLLMEKYKNRSDGKLIVFTSVTPTFLGEGKTTNTIGLSMALNSIGKKSIACIRQPSLAPTFGLKGGGTGSGHSQVVPTEEINLNFTGDFNAVTNAQNICAAMLDNSFFWSNPKGFHKDRITWNRVVEVNDRSLRNIAIGGGGKLHGVSRRSGVEITPASECMAILSLAKDLKDLRARLGRIVLGYTAQGKPITAEDIKVAGAMAVLLKDAFNPNLVQTVEHTPCFIHGGAFADTALGSSSVVADMLALKLSEYTVTETGFGADLGAEKFFDIKCRESGLKPDVVVINCTVRAMKIHSGDFKAKGGVLSESIKREDLSAVDRGCSNLEKQVENLKMFGVPIVVCINKFERDTRKELNIIIKRAEALQVDGIAVSEVFHLGSEGGKELAKAVVKAANIKPKFHYLYPVDMNIKNKIERVAKSMYGASDVKYSEEAISSIALIEAAGLFKVPVCMEKSSLSLSNNPKKKGRPKGFTVAVENVEIAAGAGYIRVECDGVNRMPSLPEKPRVAKFDIDVKTGQIKGLG